MRGEASPFPFRFPLLSLFPCLFPSVFPAPFPAGSLQPRGSAGEPWALPLGQSFVSLRGNTDTPPIPHAPLPSHTHRETGVGNFGVAAGVAASDPVREAKIDGLRGLLRIIHPSHFTLFHQHAPASPWLCVRSRKVSPGLSRYNRVPDVLCSTNRKAVDLKYIQSFIVKIYSC